MTNWEEWNDTIVVIVGQIEFKKDNSNNIKLIIDTNNAVSKEIKDTEITSKKLKEKFN